MKFSYFFWKIFEMFIIPYFPTDSPKNFTTEEFLQLFVLFFLHSIVFLLYINSFLKYINCIFI